MAFVGTTRGLKQGAQAGVVQGPVQSEPTLAGRDGEDVPGRLQALQHLRHPFEQGQFMVAGEIVKTIAINHRLVTVGWQIRNGVPHGVDQSKADNVPGLAVLRHRQVKINTRGLDGLNNGARGVQQSAVPVEVLLCFKNGFMQNRRYGKA